MAIINNRYKPGEHYDTETGETWCDEVPIVCECDYCGDPIREGDDMTVFIRPGKLGRVHVCEGCARENKIPLGGEFADWLFEELGVWAYTEEAREAERVAVGKEIEMKRQAEEVEKIRRDALEAYRRAVEKSMMGVRQG